MKYFFDTEFIESAVGTELVSIGIVAEDGRTFYAECSSFDERNADEWVRDNVLSKLDYWNYGPGDTPPNTTIEETEKSFIYFGTESAIKTALISWMLRDDDPEFYAYYCSYDWIVFARLFGRLIDLPHNYPMWCIDLKQMMWERGLDKEWKRQACPDPEGEHNALVDAQWNLQLYNQIMNSNISET